jgi:hypothetical protein
MKCSRRCVDGLILGGVDRVVVALTIATVASHIIHCFARLRRNESSGAAPDPLVDETGVLRAKRVNPGT